MSTTDCSSLADRWLNSLQKYWKAIEDARIGAPMGKGKAEAAYNVCLEIIELAKAKNCKMKTFDSYGDGEIWKKKVAGRLPF